MDLTKKPKIISTEFLSSLIPQLLLSVSIFSFVFSYSTSLSSSSSSSLLYSPKFHYFSSNYFHLLKHALNKNFLFLVCNGLLVFVVKTSGFVRPPSAHEINDMLQKRIYGDCAPQTLLEAKLETLLEKFVVSSQEIISNDDDQPKEDDEDSHDDGQKKLGDDDEERRNEVSIFIAESEEEDVKKCELAVGDDDSRKFWLFNEDDDVHDHDDQEQQLPYGELDDNDDEDVDEEVSTEELNRKFEEFIRRMKEEIIINEARQKGGEKTVIMN